MDNITLKLVQKIDALKSTDFLTAKKKQVLSNVLKLKFLTYTFASYYKKHWIETINRVNLNKSDFCRLKRASAFIKSNLIRA